MTHTTRLVAGAVAGLVMMLGCSKGDEPVKLASGQPSAATATPATATPAGAAMPQPASAAASAETVTGPVLETMDASEYTYVKVKTDKGDIWAASGKFPVAVGERVVVPLETPMTNFHSERLKRDFPLIYFTSQITKEGQTPAATPAAQMPPPVAVSHGQQPAAPPMGHGVVPQSQVTEKIAPAPGGMSIADVWAKRASLAGKSVTVRGKVVKFNGGIMGKNWMHIQDGSGVAKDGTHDLTITSNGEAKVGDVITATGKVAVDKDFGAGYAYKVIVEEANIGVK